MNKFRNGQHSLCFFVSLALILASCGGEPVQEEERTDPQVLGGKFDVPSWIKHVPASWSCDTTVKGMFKGFDSAHMYSFPGKIGYRYTFEFEATYSPWKGAVLAVYDAETGLRVARKRARWDNEVKLIYAAERNVKYLVAVYSVSWWASGSYNLSAGCKLTAPAPTTKCEHNSGYCAHYLDTCKKGHVSTPPGDCPLGKSGQCCLPAVLLNNINKSYSTKQQVSPNLVNNMQQSIFLDGCSVFAWEQKTTSGWISHGPDTICVWEGIAKEHKGGTYAQSLALPKPGTWRVTATYGVGCKAGLPLSQAGCASFETVKSAPFLVTDCKTTGCSGQLCSDKTIVTTCEAKPWYSCYKSAECGSFWPNSTCGWKQTTALKSCLATFGK